MTTNLLADLLIKKYGEILFVSNPNNNNTTDTKLSFVDWKSLHLKWRTYFNIIPKYTKYCFHFKNGLKLEYTTGMEI